MDGVSFEGDFYDYVHACGYVDQAWNRRVLEYYVPYFAHCEQVLDIGCGEGQMLELLAAAGVTASGIDADAKMVQVCQARSLQVQLANLLDYLPDQHAKYDGIFSSNLIEHLTPEQATLFLNLAFQALKPGGILLLATPNSESLIVHMFEFWRDITHVRLYHQSLLEFLLYRAGLRNIISNENPRTAWRLAQQPALPVIPPAYRSAGLSTVSAFQGLPSGTGSQQQSNSVWAPAKPQQRLAWWRRPAWWLRRRLASFLVRSIMYEEFATIEQRLGGLYGATSELYGATSELYGAASEFAVHAQTTDSALETHAHTLRGIVKGQLVPLEAAIVPPLQRPREIFAVGIKPLSDGSIPGLPEEATSQSAPVELRTPEVAAEADLPESETFGPNHSTDQDLAQREAVAQPQAALLRQYTGAPRVAVFTPYLPYPPDNGGKIRSYQLLRALAARCDVDLYSVHFGAEPPQETITALREFCCQVVSLAVEKPWRTRDRWRRAFASLPRSADYFMTPDSLALADRHLRAGQYAAVVADEICMSPYAELAPYLPRVIARQKVDHLHYAEMAKARPWGSEKVLDSLEATKLRNYERAKMPLYQAFMACSQHDVEIIGRDAPEAQALVVPNGVDLDAFVPSGAPKTGEPILLFVGAMHYYPNIDAMRFFFETMYERIIQALPNLRIQIVGHSPVPEIQQLAQRPGVAVVGSVPDMRPYLEAATVFMVPLRLGGGTRLKIVEAMAMGLPVVSTSVGAEGLAISPGNDILIADAPSSFVEDVLRLLNDGELRTRLSAGGRQLAKRYNWCELMRPFADLVETIAKQRNGEER